MALDFNGYRILATAALPAMADPRDLIDTTKATSLLTIEKAEDDKDGWELAQEALRARIQVCSARTLIHELPVHGISRSIKHKCFGRVYFRLLNSCYVNCRESDVLSIWHRTQFVQMIRTKILL